MFHGPEKAFLLARFWSRVTKRVYARRVPAPALVRREQKKKWGGGEQRRLNNAVPMCKVRF